MRTKRNRLRAGALAGLVAGSLVLAGCAESDRDNGDGGGGDSEAGGTFVFAGSAEPVALDPFFVSDGESFRVARQIFEGLVGTVPGTADPAPLLAKSWEVSDDGLSYTFDLETGVKFHDGTDFNAEAVCANFDRWYNMPETAQTEDLTYYYGALFRGFATGENSKAAVYDSCTADGDATATIVLKKPFAGFIAALSLPAFSMQSPSALEEFQDDAAENPRNTEYSTAHPTGTGPFVFEAWNREENVTLARNDDYWGEKAKIDKAVVVAIDDPKARADALTNEEIDGFDLVGPADLGPLEDAGMQIENRPAFNVLYLGMNQKQKPLDDLRVRQAIAHAINLEEVISTSMPEGTEAATQFIPEVVNGYASDVTTYDYDPAKAKSLLEDAGAAGATIEFNYPTGVSRPYMPDPEGTFNIIRTQLQAVGLKITPTADQWDPDYLEKIQGTDKHGIHLLGWTGDYNDTDNFLGVFFGQESNEWGFKNAEIFQGLDEARGIPTVEEQTPLYEEINRQVMEYLPGVPIAHPVPSLGFAPGVEGYEPSPVQDEVWNLITVSNE
ncbi:ABC transporter substrate-binding protein [Nocardioides sp. cx-169]|uniref:ABC transporter substrate-binding protein n=1 Tax=Nocardioides sp. cx-169 TaxID=2899080 RepID=UPI001E53AF78|nr:ABC transporter substrate-binding protein [Nocardioides sp. cx-169]MCD4535309.1 ABC transporter substrate-binding protein [Nocardioides sp. cx-169]